MTTKFDEDNLNLTYIAYSQDNFAEKIKLKELKYISSGAFGSVYQGVLNNKDVAVKKIQEIEAAMTREVNIMSQLNHANVVRMKYYFYTKSRTKDKNFTNIVMEYMPNDLHNIIKSYAKINQTMPVKDIKIYSYQMFCGLKYIHSLGICHRDIKPKNILINQENGLLKLCDFGTSKYLKEDEDNTTYICSRNYRAPELIFEAKNYTTKIDIWSSACVVAEMFLGKMLFVARSNEILLLEIMKLLGAPSEKQIIEMNPNGKEFYMPTLSDDEKEKLSSKLSQFKISEANVLISKLLQYSPKERLSASDACLEKFYSDIRTLSNGRVVYRNENNVAT